MNIRIIGNGFIAKHLQQICFERGHSTTSHDTDACIIASGPSRPQLFTEGRVDIGALLNDYYRVLYRSSLAWAFNGPVVLLSSIDVRSNNNLYTAFKLAQEAMLSAWAAQHSRPHSIIRTSCVFGPGMGLERFVPQAARLIANRKPVPVHTTADGAEAYRSWTYAPALANYTMDELESAEHGRVLPSLQSYANINLSARQMAEAIASAMNCPPPLLQQERNFFSSRTHCVNSAVSDPQPAPEPLRVQLRRTLYALRLLPEQQQNGASE